MKTPKLFLPIVLVLAVLLSTALAQKADKPWTDWTKEEVQKMLNNSPWAQLQTETDTSEMMYMPTSPGNTRANDASRQAIGATNQSVNVKFFVRLFSARPIRGALARQLMLQQKLPDTAVEGLRQFAERKSPDSIIFTVIYESNDQRYGNSVMQAFASNITSTLKNTTYLQRNDGKQLFLEEYVPPGKDGFGARFIFLKNPDGKPFFDANSGEIHFVAQFSGLPKIERRFKIANLMYKGELEF
jgi:hypothetical protein